MTRGLTTMGRQSQCLNWSVMVFLVSYSLSLCTLSPLTHADAVRRAGQTPHLPSEHCAQRFPAAQTTTQPTTTHERTPEPFCCELRGAANKAISVASLSTGTSPLLVVTLLLPRMDALAEEEQVLRIIQALHSSRPPPLYLLHAAFRI